MSRDDTPPLPPTARPRLRKGVRMVRDEVRKTWMLLAPERVFQSDAIASDILRRCDGKATLAAIVDDLAKEYGAPRERIEQDVTRMLGGLAEKRLLEF